MTDDEFLTEAKPWIKELVRRQLLAVQVHIPATAVTPARIAHAWPDDRAFLDLEGQFALIVEKWFDEEPDTDLRQQFPANRKQPPRPVE